MQQLHLLPSPICEAAVRVFRLALDGKLFPSPSGLTALVVLKGQLALFAHCSQLLVATIPPPAAFLSAPPKLPAAPLIHEAADAIR